MTSRLRVVYRTCAAESLKNRPPFYSKMLALQSFLWSVEELEEQTGQRAEIVFLTDGDMPKDRLDLMDRSGLVIPIRGGSNRRTYRKAISFGATFWKWDDDDLIWFAEDDYLYHPRAMCELFRNSVQLPEVDYFSLYSPRDCDNLHFTSWPVSTGWIPATSTTSTFGVRCGALREDRALLRFMPFVGAAWDFASCHVVRGEAPYPDGRLDFEIKGITGPRRWALEVMGKVANVLANRRRHPRQMVASMPILIWHMEGEPPSDEWVRIASVLKTGVADA